MIFPLMGTISGGKDIAMFEHANGYCSKQSLKDYIDFNSEKKQLITVKVSRVPLNLF